MKLHQTLAALNNVKSNTKSKIAGICHQIQKTDLYFGFNRGYTPNDEEGQPYPGERKLVRQSVAKDIESFKEAMKTYLDIAAIQDYTNTEAKGTIVIDGETLLADVPVTYLLFLEHQIQETKTFISKLPTLPLDSQWTYNDYASLYMAEAIRTLKTKKVTEFVEASPATKEHPAQIREVTKDIVEGTWIKTDHSGAIPENIKERLLSQVQKLHQAIVIAREEANRHEAIVNEPGEVLLNFIFRVMVD